MKIIDGVSMKQTLVGQWFNYGDITLHFANKVYTLRYVGNPGYIASIITDCSSVGEKDNTI